MPNDYSAKIKAARDAGYSDDEIAAFIGKSDSKMAEALQQGYSGTEILKHLETAAPESAPAAPKSVWQRLKEGFQGPEVMKNVVSEGQLASASRFAAPGATQTPLAPGISEAGAVANFGVRPTMGMPAPNVAGVVGDVASGLKEGTAILGRTPTNEVRPIIHGASRMAGVAAGGQLGSAGAYMGGVAGPELAEAIIPKRTVAEQLKAPTSEAVKVPVSESEAAPPKLAGEGRPATWTNEKVVELAKQNNPDAIAQVKARKLDFPGSRYMTGEQMPSSPEYQSKGGITRFDAEGKPIVEGQPANAAAARTQAGPKITTDAQGTKWAEGNGVKVSITPGMTDAEIAAKLSDQATQQAAIRAKYGAGGSQPANKFSIRSPASTGATEASRLKLPNPSELEQRYVEDIMNSKGYESLSDTDKRQLLENRIFKLGGR